MAFFSSAIYHLRNPGLRTAVRQEAMGDLTFLHYQNPVALIPRFFNFIADHQYRNAMSRQIADNAVYSCFVGDINTDSRAIENQQSWPNRQPFGDRYSLRVTPESVFTGRCGSETLMVNALISLSTRSRTLASLRKPKRSLPCEKQC